MGRAGLSPALSSRGGLTEERPYRTAMGTLVSLLIAVPDALAQGSHKFLERGPKGMVHCLGTHIRSRSHEMGCQAKRGAGLGPALDGNMGFINAERIGESLQALAQEGLEGDGYLVGVLFETEFHDLKRIPQGP